MRKHRISRSVRASIMAWSLVVGCLLLVGVSFAWFTRVERVAESKTTNVMRPYELFLLNPGETSVMQLSIGNLMPGRTKQILFCVSNKNNENLINMGGGDFDYSLELVHTENLALIYQLYALVEVDEADKDGEGVLVSEDTVTDDRGNTTTTYSYWKKESEALVNEDVSAKRHEAVGLDAEALPVNKGKYLAYTNEKNEGLFHLKDDENGYASEYFLLEIDWENIDNFAKYDKETDVIYLTVKALLPEPETKSE